MKTTELTGPALVWAVAKCEIVEPGRSSGKSFLPEHKVYLEDFIPSYSWAQGGPIIEREKIAIMLCESVGDWLADLSGTDKVFTTSGPTPLIAAMRCYVACKLGDEVEIPEALK